jgi:predicted RNA-binding protein
MCLATAYRTDDPESIILEYVSKLEVRDNQVILTDIMGDTRTIEGTLAMADLTGGVVRIHCAEN